MKTEQRVKFPSFERVHTADTSTHEVEIGRITRGDEVFIVHMIRRAGLPFEGDFLVAKVFDSSGNKLLWEFPKNSFNGLGLLAQAGDEIVVALVGKGRAGKVEGVSPLSSIAKQKPTDLFHKIELKRLAAEYLGRSYYLTDTEQKVLERDSERRRQEEEAERKRQHEARQQARAKLVTRVMSRDRVEVYTSDGRKRFGLPVVGDEWHSLSNGTYVVVVECYDDETGMMGDPIEAFQIIKEKGKNAKKGFPAPVTWERSSVNVWTGAKSSSRPVSTIVIETSAGKVFEVVVYPTMDDIRKARADGLNSGTFVAALDRMVGKRYEVLSVHADRVETLGLYEPIA